ncbi:MAG: helix-turn-helix domain-containing protein [Candidatus Methylomirabilis oxyfera]|nr:helix-turn-helix domain-containing protein [Candidatus Methylomirabilis oxyfera]
MQTKQISLEQAAERLSVSPRSLSDRRYRIRLGLAAVRIGRRLTFSETDLERIIREGRERLPGEGRR